jgi:hypothetical protein
MWNRYQDVEKVLQLRSRIAQRLNVRRRVRFASSLAAALLDGLFEHPVGYADSVCRGVPSVKFSFSSASTLRIWMKLPKTCYGALAWIHNE